MVDRGAGQILNVSSTASFMPGPLQAVYYATKAYVTSFSQAIANELEGSGVTVTALCPGAVATDFQKRGNLEGIDLWNKAPSADKVAEFGYKAMEKGELVAINDAALRFMVNNVVPLMSRKTVLKVSRKTMEK
jgi:short-subunit dehydrogenase